MWKKILPLLFVLLVGAGTVRWTVLMRRRLANLEFELKRSHSQFVTLGGVLSSVSGRLRSSGDRIELINDTSPLKALKFLRLEDFYARKFYFSTDGGVPPFFGTDLAVGDFDGDGRGDILVGRIPVFEVKTPGVYLILSSRWKMSGGPRDVRLPAGIEMKIATPDVYGAGFGGDLDGDGRDEAFVGERARILPSSSVDSNTREFSVENKAFGGGDIALKGIEDVDGDGRADVIVRTAKSTAIYSGSEIFRNGKKPTDLKAGLQRLAPLFRLPELTNTRLDYSYMTFPDLDGDGRPEIIGVDTLGQGADAVLICPSVAHYDAKACARITFKKANRGGHEIRPTLFGDFDGDQVPDLWIQDPLAYNACLVTGSTLKGLLRKPENENRIEEVTQLTMRAQTENPNYKLSHGLLGFNRIAADYDGDGMVDFVASNAAMFDGRGALFVIPGRLIRAKMKERAKEILFTDASVLRLALFSTPISWLSPMAIGGSLDVTGDGTPDIVLGADYDIQGGVGGGAIYVVDGARVGETLRSL